jgi:hypothetical protein
MSSFDSVREALEAALGCAGRIAELSHSLVNRQDWFRDELRRLRRDLPHLIRKALAAFPGDEHLADDLRHELACLEEDAAGMAEWAGGAADELRRLFEAIGPDGDASLRYGQAVEEAGQECLRQRQVVLESCNRAYGVAARVCTAADRTAAPKKLAKNPPGDDNRPRWDKGNRQLLLPGDGSPVKWGRVASTQFPILDALEAAGWPENGVELPGVLTAGQIKNAVEALNDRLAATRLRLGREQQDNNPWRITWHLAAV